MSTKPVPPFMSTDSATRKLMPVASGVLAYFPDALMCVSWISRVGNEKHNKGEPLHWAKEKSGDEPDAEVRHMLDFVRDLPPDPGLEPLGKLGHLASKAWRALAHLQRACDEARAEAEAAEQPAEVEAMVYPPEREDVQEWSDVSITLDGKPWPLPVERVTKSEPFELVIDFKVTPDGKAENTNKSLADVIRAWLGASAPVGIRPQLEPRVLITPPTAPKLRAGDVVQHMHTLVDSQGVFVEYTPESIGGDCIVDWSSGYCKGSEERARSTHLKLLRRPVRAGDVLRASPEHGNYENCDATQWRNTVRGVDARGIDFEDIIGRSCLNDCSPAPFAEYLHADGTPIEPPIDPDAPVCGAV